MSRASVRASRQKLASGRGGRHVELGLQRVGATSFGDPRRASRRALRARRRGRVLQQRNANHGQRGIGRRPADLRARHAVRRRWLRDARAQPAPAREAPVRHGPSRAHEDPSQPLARLQAFARADGGSRRSPRRDPAPRLAELPPVAHARGLRRALRRGGRRRRARFVVARVAGSDAARAVSPRSARHVHRHRRPDRGRVPDRDAHVLRARRDALRDGAPAFAPRRHRPARPRRLQRARLLPAARPAPDARRQTLGRMPRRRHGLRRQRARSPRLVCHLRREPSLYDGHRRDKDHRRGGDHRRRRHRRDLADRSHRLPHALRPGREPHHDDARAQHRRRAGGQRSRRRGGPRHGVVGGHRPERDDQLRLRGRRRPERRRRDVLRDRAELRRRPQRELRRVRARGDHVGRRRPPSLRLGRESRGHHLHGRRGRLRRGRLRRRDRQKVGST